jgi:hypothetical protein
MPDGEIQTVSTEGGTLVSVPAENSIYLVEKLPFTPMGYTVTDIKAIAEKKLAEMS